ncbi:MAG: endolytic transglycosylase MltG, partial [Eubacteriales bacterium]|nr:endolytic transglycosylase MltG [Eubacteriales bacterium]
MPRNRSPYGRRHETDRYTQRTLHRDREFGFYWYAWLWKAARPLLVLLCSLVVVLGIFARGWTMVNERLLMAVQPGSADTVDFVIEKGDSAAKIALNLEGQQLVRNPAIFRYIVQFRGLTSKLQAGNYPLTRGMTVWDVVDKLTEGSASNERTITIIPGWTIDDIARYLNRQGAVKGEAEFLALANDGERFKDTSYRMQDAAQKGTMEGRKYQLEGYLAPDTYRVYSNATAEDIVKRLLSQTDSVIDQVFTEPPPIEVVRDEAGNIVTADDPEEDADAEGEEAEPAEEIPFATTLDREQTIILASIIEKEAGRKADYRRVSAVFHNRLEKGMRLESDATAAYPLGIRRIVLTADELMSANGY